MLKPYGEYKPVEYDWLNTIPQHWNKRTVRSITKVSDKRNGSASDNELLSVYRDFGVIKKSSRDDNHNVESADLSNYKLVSVGDLVMNKMKMWQGSLGISKYNGIVSPAYIVCNITVDENSKYLHYLLRSPKFKTFYNRISYGVRVGQWDMRYDDFKSLSIYFPPREEQNQIVRYLDWKLSQINKLIKAKKKQIALLKEQKQAIINQAVTKGLNPDAEMKDSGVEWLGEIPEGWHIRPFSKIARVCANLVSPLLYQDYTQVSPANIEKATGKLLPCETVHQAGIISDNHLFFKGQILYSKIRPLLNKVTIAPFDGLCSADMYPIETFLDTKFLVYFMLSHTFLSQLSMTGNRVKMPKINREELAGVLIVFPTNEEQKIIVNRLEQAFVPIDRLEEKYNYEISLISEYRTRLISDVVTGKVDVRGIEIPAYDAEAEEVADADEGEIEEMESN